MERRIPALGWGLCALALSLMGVALGLQQVTGGALDDGTLLEDLALLVGFASFPVLGGVIAARQPENPLGWILIAVGVCIGLLIAGGEYAYLSFVHLKRDLPLTTLALWFEQWLWYPALGFISPFALLLFPDGRPPTKRWRWVLWAGAGCLAIIVVVATFQERFYGEGYSVDNPIGLGLPYVEEAIAPVFGFFGFVALAGPAGLLVRFKRSRGEERQQLKLLAYGGALSVLVSVFGGLVPALPESLFAITIWFVPLAITLAILRYRLYDIDLIVNRTLVYALLSGALAAMYLGIVVVLQQALGGVTQDSDLAVAGSTLAVAAMFRPLRSRIQAFIDRRFYRRRYDARLTLESFSSRLRHDVDLQHLATDLAGVVEETMQPSHVSVWLRSPETAVRS
ncbi:MAG TPA: hypothetical protein VJ927_00420 [Actinomycetota bacterium]|nr:hypothetical protein [Actinomycetota bacterium]